MKECNLCGTRMCVDLNRGRLSVDWIGGRDKVTIEEKKIEECEIREDRLRGELPTDYDLTGMPTERID